MIWKARLLLVGCLNLTPFADAELPNSTRTPPDQTSAPDSISFHKEVDARCIGKSFEGCLGERYNFGTKSCTCAPSGVCSEAI
jgi:hypothetical protein